MADFVGRDTLADKVSLLLHAKRPDYHSALLQITEEQETRLLRLLALLYGSDTAESLMPEVIRHLRVHYAHKTPELLEAECQSSKEDIFTERDMVMITYGDLIQSPPRKPLEVLSTVTNIFLGDVVSTIHVLPFFPYSSDRGFSVVDFREVDPNLGSWDDIERANTQFRLMFDGVVNHVSSQSEWFQEFLNGNAEYENFFLHFPSADSISADDLRHILRPRISPLLTEVQTINGPKFVWTTFSADQIDLNFHNPVVLLKVLQVLLFYIQKGADLIRIDAATYLWKELGTSCAHLPQTHGIVQFLRAALDIVAPRVALLTETNVPHEDNISYFGDGSNEAHMVYNFALPPLVLHTFHSGNCCALSRWAATLEKFSTTTTFFNFLDSHDGIGLLGARGILDEEEINALVLLVIEHGGFVSYRSAGDGSKSPYELNITWFNALNNRKSNEPVSLMVDRFIASRAIALVLSGVPGIYLPSITGSQIAPMDTAEITEPRAINRLNFREADMIEALMDADSIAYQVAMRFRKLAEHRVNIPALHPNGRQKILPTEGQVFGVWRHYTRQEQGQDSTLLALVNVTAEPQPKEIATVLLESDALVWQDCLTGRIYQRDADLLRLVLRPYEVLWLQPGACASQP